MTLVACELVGSGRRATSVALACRAQGFETLGVDALWETREELLRSLKTFPGGVYADGRMCCECSTGIHFIFPQVSDLEVFRTTPDTPGTDSLPEARSENTKAQWDGTLGTSSLGVFSVLQLCAINEPLFPNLKTLDLRLVTEEFTPFISRFSPLESPQSASCLIAPSKPPSLQ